MTKVAEIRYTLKAFNPNSIMPLEPTKTKSEAILSVFCPYLKRTVILKEKTWRYYIIPKHPEVRNCRNFIEQTLSQDAPDIFKYRKIRDHNELTIQRQCHLLTPRFNDIRIGIKLINDKEAVVATACGANNKPKSGVEEIK